ncbi:MlaD family protein [Sediminispirochaeta bajacaliforniensis]|uniref:MlaD family protein n=1 Tax=Sediminispirochaeta bajacaliforniensis TaxID=148 RepID=UPI000362D44D|nr:MlaD family protein [Sediminispirochaeta bajacaliforniensis]
MSRLLKIGLFVAITGTVSIVYIMQTVEAIDADETKLIHAYMDDASGLLPESLVRLSGVNIGKVTKIVLEDGKAKVTMEVNAEVPIYQDARVVKKMDSILGNSIVSIVPGNMNTGIIPPNGVVRYVESSTVMNKAFESTQKVAEELEQLLAEFRTFMNNSGYSEMNDILVSAKSTVAVTGDLVQQNLLILRSAMTDIAAVAERINSQSEAESDDISAILDHTARLTERLDTMLAENDRNLERAVAEMRKSAETLTAVLESTRSIARKIDDGEGNLGKLVNDEELYHRIVGITENVEGFVDSTVGMNVELGLQGDYMVQASGMETRAELRLIPGEKPKEYWVGVTVPPGSDDYSDADVNISAELVRRYGPLAIRGGIIESSGGIGFDLRPLRQVELSTQMYRLGRDAGPVMDASGTFYPFFDPTSENPLRWLYMTAGVRDFVIQDDFDYHFGVGLRFFDNDLKGIIQYVPSP